MACFRSDSAKSEVMDELEVLYEDLPNISARLERMNAIGEGLYFCEDEDESNENGNVEDLAGIEDSFNLKKEGKNI